MANITNSFPSYILYKADYFEATKTRFSKYVFMLYKKGTEGKVNEN